MVISYIFKVSLYFCLVLGILIAKKPVFRRLNTCEPDGFFASSETEKVLKSTVWMSEG